MMIGYKYKITYPCYDDYNEGLEPEIDIVEVVQKYKDGLLLKNLEHDYNYLSKFNILNDCKIETYEN